LYGLDGAGRVVYAVCSGDALGVAWARVGESLSRNQGLSTSRLKETAWCGGRTALLECVVQLEETAANPWVTLQLVDGDWKLAWSTVAAPERASSPLFWAVQSFTDTLTQQGTADLVFRLTDAVKGAVGLRCALPA